MALRNGSLDSASMYHVRQDEVITVFHHDSSNSRITIYTVRGAEMTARYLF